MISQLVAANNLRLKSSVIIIKLKPLAFTNNVAFDAVIFIIPVF